MLIMKEMRYEKLCKFRIQCKKFIFFENFNICFKHSSIPKRNFLSKQIILLCKVCKILKIRLYFFSIFIQFLLLS